MSLPRPMEGPTKLSENDTGLRSSDKTNNIGPAPVEPKETVQIYQLKAVSELPEKYPLPSETESVEFAITMDTHFVNHEKYLEEDGRWDYLLRMQNTMNETFDNAAWIHPHGMTSYDHCLIPECREKEFKNFKVAVRRQNYTYMHGHPEFDALMSLFIKKLLKTQPKDPVRFAVEFFSFRRLAPEDMQRQVSQELSKLKQVQNPKGWKENSTTWHADVNSLKDVNEVKTLSLGPSTQNFGFTPPPSPSKPSSVKIKKIKPKKHVYCGCKDPGRRLLPHNTEDGTKVQEVTGKEGTCLPVYH